MPPWHTAMRRSGDKEDNENLDLSDCDFFEPLKLWRKAEEKNI